MRFYSDRCQPPWTDREIDHKLIDARKATDHRWARGYLLPPLSGDGHNGERQKEDLRKEIFEALKKGAVKGAAFRKLKITPRKRLLGDWFREGATGFIFSRRGVGKTWIAWAIARALAAGEELGPWEAGEEAVSVCYLDGEMPAEMQRREISFGDECENLTLVSHEILFALTGVVLNLRLPEVQQAITQFCVDTDQKVLVVDNLSTLVSGVKENDSDAWELLLPWLLDLRRRKIAVILVHHAGRSGEMRGTSRREDSVFWIIKLEEDPDYNDKGCSFIQRFDKERNSPQSHYNHYIWTFKPTGECYDNPSGSIEITYKTASLKSRVYDLIVDGLTTCRQIAEELGASPSSISRAAKELAKECLGHTGGQCA
jgi:AAA domain